MIFKYRKRSTTYLLTVLACTVLHASCSTPTRPEESEDTVVQPSFCLNEQLKQSTEIIEVERQPIREQLSLSGKIEYDENNMTVFRSLLDGVVEDVRFELGDQVQKGQVLATVSSSQIQELHQQKRYQENQIILLEKQLKNKEEMAADGLLAGADVLAGAHELESARIDLERVNQSLALYRATDKGAFHILAPKDGYIVQKSISTGQSITADSEPLFSLSNLKQVWVMVNIYANNLRYVHAGDKVKVRTIAYPDQVYDGTIDKIYNVFDDNEHVLKARVVLANQNLKLMPGLSADILINMNNGEETAYAIPNRAKIFNNNKEYVVVYKDDCHLEIREISSVGRNEQYTFIADTLGKEERIIGVNALLIFEGLNQR